MLIPHLLTIGHVSKNKHTIAPPNILPITPSPASAIGTSRCRVELDKFAPEGDEDEQAMRIKLLIYRSKNKKLLEMDSFLPPQTYLESWQTIDFGKRKLKTLGDGYAPLTAQTTIKKKQS